MNCCPKCKTEHSEPLKNENGDLVYWIASYKDTEDFFILLSGQNEPVFISSLDSEYPKDSRNVYDYYCTNCFLDIAERDNFSSGRQ